MIIALYVVAAIVAVIVLLVLVAPKTYNVSRSISINKPVAEVFQYLKHIKNQTKTSQIMMERLVL